MEHSKRSMQRWAVFALASAFAPLALAGNQYDLRNGTVAGGGSVAEAGAFRLVSTIGEPAMGTTSASPFRLTSGFPATIGDALQGAPTGGRIFADGFED